MAAGPQRGVAATTLPATAWLAGAGMLGAGLGTAATAADEVAGPLGLWLSLPGPWLVAAAVVGAVTSRRVASSRPPQECSSGRATRGYARGLAAVTTTLFLVGAMVAYYATKQFVLGAIPGPLAAFWLLLAATVGLAGGALTAQIATRPWGTRALVGAACGWLAVEGATAPLAAEAGLAGVGAALAITAAGPARLRAVGGGAAVGAAAAVLVLAALPHALTAVLP